MNIPTIDPQKEIELNRLLKEMGTIKGAEDGSEEEKLGEYIGSLKGLFGCSAGQYFHPSSGFIVGSLVEIEHSMIEQETKGKVTEAEIEKATQKAKGKAQEILDNIALRMNSIVKSISKELNSNPDGASPEDILLYRSILDLSDIVSIEVIRLGKVYKEFQEMANSAVAKYKDAQLLNTSSIDRLTRATRQSNRAIREASTVKTEVITILSIFASIVLVFAGGLTVLGNAIVASQSIIIYKVSSIALICILGLFDSAFILLYAAARITDRSLLVQCPKWKIDEQIEKQREDKRKARQDQGLGIDTEENEPATCKECKYMHPKESSAKRCSSFKRFYRCLPYVFWFNALVMIGIAIVLVVWFLRITVLK